MKKVLVIAYAFPPMAYAGVYRTLRFCKYLPRFGWQPIVLTIKDYPYHRKDYSLLKQLSKDIKVYRTSTIDPIMRYRSKRASLENSNLNTIGKNPNEKSTKKPRLGKPILLKRLKSLVVEILTFPDRNVLWLPFAVFEGIKVILKERPDVVYTSSPPHSSQLIGLLLSKLFKKPWVADFRDPWVDNVYFEQSSASYLKTINYLESLVINNSTNTLLNTNSNRNRILQRYSYLDHRKFHTLTNGFDADDAEGLIPANNEKFTITFLGTIYPYFKTGLFLEGLKIWLKDNKKNNITNTFQVLFLGGKNYPKLQKVVKEQELFSVVKFIDFLPKKKAMKICMKSHLLLLMLGFNKASERIIPLKLFDYLLCKKPILAIAPEGEVAELIRKTRIGYVISDEKPEFIAQIINTEYRKFINKEEFVNSPDYNEIEKYDSIRLSNKLSAIFDKVSRVKENA